MILVTDFRSRLKSVTKRAYRIAPKQTLRGSKTQNNFLDPFHDSPFTPPFKSLNP